MHDPNCKWCKGTGFCGPSVCSCYLVYDRRRRILADRGEDVAETTETIIRDHAARPQPEEPMPDRHTVENARHQYAEVVTAVGLGLLVAVVALVGALMRPTIDDTRRGVNEARHLADDLKATNDRKQAILETLQQLEPLEAAGTLTPQQADDLANARAAAKRETWR